MEEKAFELTSLAPELILFTIIHSALYRRHYYPCQINKEIEVHQDYMTYPVISVAKPTLEPKDTV